MIENNQLKLTESWAVDLWSCFLTGCDWPILFGQKGGHWHKTFMIWQSWSTKLLSHPLINLYNILMTSNTFYNFLGLLPPPINFLELLQSSMISVIFFNPLRTSLTFHWIYNLLETSLSLDKLLWTSKTFCRLTKPSKTPNKFHWKGRRFPLGNSPKV